MIAADDGVIATKMTTTVLEISTRIMIAHRILNFLVHSKNQWTLENGEEDEEFDEVVLTPTVDELR